MSGRFAGRRALVTGGAGAIGLATARELAAGGARVALLDHSDAALAAATAGAELVGVRANVADAAQVAAALGAAVDALGGPVDLLVNAAGVYRIARMLELSEGEWEDVLRTNLRGCWIVARAVARELVAAGRPGSIVNVSSIAGLVADPAEPAAHYDASKAGMIALTRAMAVEWARYGIRANAVCQGVIDTPMLRVMDDPEAGRRYLEQCVPLGRLGRAEEVAHVVAFLASDEASYVTGAMVPIDGGATAI